MKYTLQYKKYSENSILIEWPSKIDEDILRDILFYKSNIKSKSPEPIVDIIHGYCSLLICYKYTIDNFYTRFSMLKSLYSSNVLPKDENNRIWKIPVCYSTILAMDLDQYSKIKSLSIEEIIVMHTAPLYRLFFIGFLPGFLYLGGLDEKLHLPRKKTPSLQIEKGSVSIGGSQTGVYPISSPGGWHVIGKTPVDFFNSKLNNPCFAQPGNRIQFESIGIEEFDEISVQVANKSYQFQFLDV